MITRYNPHALVGKVGEWAAQAVALPAGDLSGDVRGRAGSVWAGEPFWNDPRAIPLPLDAGLAAEYGIDAVRLAVLTAGLEEPPLALLESAHRWLAGLHAAFHDPGSTAVPWDPDPWLIALGTATDHLTRRGRLYPALAAVRKAWKASPVTPAAPADGRHLCLSLVHPFAPVLSRFLLEEAGRWPPPSLAWLGTRFPERQAVRLSLERGGWQWVAVDRNRFREDPRAVVAGLPWVGRALTGRDWRLSERPEGWKVCLSQA